MADLNSEQDKKKYSELIAKAWMDENFKKKLIQNPDQTMKEFGIEVPSGLHIKVVENTKDNIYLVVPNKPDQKLTEEDFKRSSGGGWQPQSNSVCGP